MGEPPRDICSKSSGELVVSPSKKLSGSGDRQKKKAKMDNDEGAQESPSVFERLGNRGDNGKTKEKHGSSAEKTQSPSVFERLGSQASCSTPKMISTSDKSIHSALVAAPFLNHSVLVTATPRNHSQHEPSSEERKNLKEGLMFNSNPSKSI